MPQYVVRLTHPPDQCPVSNSKVRERMIKGAPEMPRVAQKLGIKFLAGPLVLGAEHEGLAVVETTSVEVIHEFLLQTGLVQWNSVHVSSAKSIEESMKELEKLPPPLY